MTLFTSNYARHGKDPNAVCISIKPIWWFKGRCYYPLAPTWDIVLGHKKGEIDDKGYTTEYLKILAKLDPKKVVEDLGDGAIMLCYESPKDFCHRHIVAHWLNKELNLGVDEIFFIQQREKERKEFEAKIDYSLIEF